MCMFFISSITQPVIITSSAGRFVKKKNSPTFSYRNENNSTGSNIAL